MQLVDYTSEHISDFEKFAGRFPQTPVQQSHLWGEFQENIPYRGKFWALGVTEDAKTLGQKELVMTALIVRHATRLGYTWLEIGRGPIFDSRLSTDKMTVAWDLILDEVRRIAQAEKSILLRVAPHLQNAFTHVGRILFPDFRDAGHSAYPEWTLTLDLGYSEADLLTDMKPKGRYNIRLAEKKKVRVDVWKKEDGAGFKQFYQILKDTSRRDQFGVHPADYYRNLLETLGAYDGASLYLAYHPEKQDVVIGGTIVTFFGDTATYYYGASSHTYRALMAPYLLQWRAIRDAKKRGLRYYDFMGIAGSGGGDWDRRLEGVTRFKEKFGGETSHYMRSFELVFKPLMKVLLRP
jgi:peptidoglycan pentaglycine glycine transferase (the first glycine)